VSTFATVTPTPAIIVAGDASRTRLTLTNDSTIDVWIGLGSIPAWVWASGNYFAPFTDGAGNPAKGIYLPAGGGRWISRVWAGAVWGLIPWPNGQANVCVQAEP
jgi:hypothetical protein